MISLMNRQFSLNLQYIILTMVVGFFAFGLSIYFYIYAQRDLGAARTSTYYATSPFIGVIISWIIFRDEITGSFLIALAIMLVGTFLQYRNHIIIPISINKSLMNTSIIIPMVIIIISTK